MTVRCTVFTAPRRSARSPLEKARKKRAGAPITRSRTAAWIATEVRASKRSTASVRSTSSARAARPAAARPATIARVREAEPAGMARSMRRPVATGVSRPASAAASPVATSTPTSARVCAKAKRSTSSVPRGRALEGAVEGVGEGREPAGGVLVHRPLERRPAGGIDRDHAVARERPRHERDPAGGPGQRPPRRSRAAPGAARPRARASACRPRPTSARRGARAASAGRAPGRIPRWPSPRRSAACVCASRRTPSGPARIESAPESVVARKATPGSAIRRLPSRPPRARRSGRPRSRRARRGGRARPRGRSPARGSRRRRARWTGGARSPGTWCRACAGSPRPPPRSPDPGRSWPRRG